MKLFKYIFVFLIINFSALAIGAWLMNDGPQTDWYINLNQAPWTPPGWVFGAVWTTIMICFSVYMGYLYKILPAKNILLLFTVQFILNVLWNYVFFNQHMVGLGLTFILMLTLIIGVFMFSHYKTLKTKNLLIAPYFIWLCIATSLNAYILFYN